MIIYTVRNNYDSETLHACLRKEDAEYLADWCQAIEYNGWIDRARASGYADDEHFGHATEYFTDDLEVIE